MAEIVMLEGKGAPANALVPLADYERLRRAAEAVLQDYADLYAGLLALRDELTGGKGS